MAMTLDADVHRSAYRIAARPRPRPALSPLRRTFIIVYATLASCALLTPHPILERLRSAEPSAATNVAEKALASLEIVSDRIGAQRSFDLLRARFLAAGDRPLDDYRLRAALDD